MDIGKTINALVLGFWVNLAIFQIFVWKPMLEFKREELVYEANDQLDSATSYDDITSIINKLR